jgi:hypothetical protein
MYVSPSTVKSIWQEYLIFDDRIEFHTHFGVMVVPFEEVESATVSESEVAGLLHGDLHLKGFRPALKLDWANFLEHVVVDRSSGLIRRILFTPEDPSLFVSVLQEGLTRFSRRGREQRDEAK